MITHDTARRHRPARALAAGILSALALVLAGGVLAPASADTPSAWESAPDVSPLGFLLVLVIFPLGIAAVVTILAVLPSLASDRGYEPGESWRGDAEWFGGPARGARAADDVTPEQIEASRASTGGTSGRW